MYCGVAPGRTGDHVPPRSLFPLPRPSNLVKVPCCEACRTTQSIDDEYFKNMIVMRHDVAGSEAGRRLLDSVHKALFRPRGRGFAVGLIRSARDVEIRTSGGLYDCEDCTFTSSPTAHSQTPITFGL